MLGNSKVIVDAFCEVKEFTRHLEDAQFCSFDDHQIVPGAVYIISRQTFHANIDLIRDCAENGRMIPILGNPAEGSETILSQIRVLDIEDLVKQGRIGIISGGHLQPDIPYLYHENFLPKILDYEENIRAIEQHTQSWTDRRPYQFLCLNGRARPHRRELLRLLEPVLDQAIWTNLDGTHGQVIRTLHPEYEFDFYAANTAKNFSGFAKHDLFNNDWGEIYLKAGPYLDSYFSVVTETVFDYPHSFRTEKLWKPIAMGHPFIAVANAGYYRDLHQLGFQTFHPVIDESFDQIQDSHARLIRIVDVVKDLCRQDLADFARACYNICKYNQARLAELRPQVRQQFPNRLLRYIQQLSHARS